MDDKDGHVISHLIGDFGKWQATLSFFVSLLKLPIAWFQLNIVFLAPIPEFWCEIPTPNVARYNYLTSTAWRNETLNDCDVECEKYDYNVTIFKRTIISEWDLICEKSQLANVAQMTFMCGILVGNILFGVASDRYGRKVPLIVAIVMQAVTSFVISFVPWFWAFLLLRFFLAISTGGTMITSFVLCVEAVGGKWRTSIPILYQIPFGLANSIMSIMAYYLRDWRQLNLAMSVISMIFVSYWWLIPESPRWLLAVGRTDEAAQILEKAAKVNRLNTTEVKSILTFRSSSGSDEESPKDQKTPFLGLFKTPNLRKITISLFFNWFVAGLSVFGFSQFMSFIGGNDAIFLNFAIGGLVTIPGTILCIYVVQRFGRRNTIILSGLVYGVTCMLVGAVPAGQFPRDWPRILLAGVSLTGMAVTFPALYLYSGELLPTVARNGGLGAASMCARFGSMIAPFVLSTSVYGDWIPLLILGGLPLLAVLMIVPLPETKGCTLPDSLEDGENFGKSNVEDTTPPENGNYVPMTQT